jgi:uncharacterized membrane protein (UPF0127 family)
MALKLINLDTGQVMAWQIHEANSFFTRLKGLMFTKDLPLDCGLRIRPCQQIHTYFMQYNIDVLHLDSNHKVVALEENLSPGKLGMKHHAAVEVVELPAGLIEKTDTKVGHKLKFTENIL